MVYMCGDNDILDAHIGSDFNELCKVGSSAQTHVIVQRDRREGAGRYVLPEGRVSQPLKNEFGEQNVRVDTGDPQSAIDFLLWGIKRAPSDHVAVIISGLGLHPRYVRSILMPEHLRQDEKKRREFTERRLFSMCHDQTNRSALEAYQLRDILAAVAQQRKRPIDLLALDLGVAAFFEIAYQLRDHAEVFVASQSPLPDTGWPYDRILIEWKKQFDGNGSAEELGELIVDEVTEEFTKANMEPRMVALRLKAMETTARALDVLALALMQGLGDWHVLHALQQVFAGNKLKWVSPDIPGESKKDRASQNHADDKDSLPAVDLLDLLARTRQALRDEKDVPAAHGQQARIENLCRLLNEARRIFRPPVKRKSPAQLATKSRRQVDADAQPESLEPPPLLVCASHARGQGLSILLPAWTASESTQDSGQSFNSSDSNYRRLDFCQDVHWPALLGAFQMITEKPHTLWRLINTWLTEATGPAREVLLKWLISPSSVISDLKGHFLALAGDKALSLTLDPEPVNECDEETGRRTYRLRLESSSGGATIPQQESNVYQTTIDSALAELKRLLNSTEPLQDARNELEGPGRILGEDVIQSLAQCLNDERQLLLDETKAVPPLRLQIPSTLMRYPWELMFDRFGALGERFAVGRQVFMQQQIARRAGKREPGTIDVLVIGDPLFTDEFKRQTNLYAPQLSGARYEAQRVVDQFHELAQGELAGLIQINVTPLIGEVLTASGFRRLLRRGTFDIIHYAGHAVFNEEDPESSAWLLSDGLLRAREIRNTLAWCDSPPWLVYANACEAGMDSGTSSKVYQGDVFGLATAFINQGVSAYIAPLWPVNDLVAAQMALDFYRGLVMDRLSLGESLRQAKERVKQDLFPVEESPQLQPLAANVALSWASFVLFGDPTPQLLKSLWSPDSGVSRPPEDQELAVLAEPRKTKLKSPVRHVTQASAGKTLREITGPGLQPANYDTARGAMVSNLPVVELVEINGVRSWRIIDPVTGLSRPLPDSNLAEAAQQDKVRGALGMQRGLGNYVVVVGRWVVGRVVGSEDKSLIARLVEQYDVEQVATERLVRILPGPKLEPLPKSKGDWLDEPLSGGQQDRVLLIVHGTFGKAAKPTGSLGEEFLDWARSRYRAVIAFDHWTLSKTPEQNAQMLWDLLDPELHRGHKLDVITHSRGGLVARAFVELLGHGDAVRRVVFVGTPNAGTNLANPKNWGRAADLLVNFVHSDPLGLYGALSGMLVQLIVRQGEKEIPGLLAQNPMMLGPNDFLARLQAKGAFPADVSYAAVAANYEPHEEFNLKSLADKTFDTAVDAFFPHANDLVVDTASVWAIDQKELSLNKLNKPIPASQLLLFNPDDQVLSPPGIQLKRIRGVHHTNLFEQAETRAFLRSVLSGSDTI